MPMTLDGTAGMTAPVGAIYNGLTLMTAQTSTSGTAIDFTGVPLWVKRITVMFNNVSTNGTNSYLVQVGSGSITSSGYNSYGMTAGGNSLTGAGFTTAFGIRHTRGTAASISGAMIISNLSGNIWVSQHSMGDQANTDSYFGAGSVTLSGVLDRVRITTVNGTDTFDAGSINIMYE